MSTQLTNRPPEKRDLRSMLKSDSVKEQISLAIPKHMTPDRMLRVALTTVNTTPKLLDCDPASVLSAIMKCAAVGLEPDGRNAHLIPYGNQCQLILDYKGLVALAERNGVESIYADRVCDNDDFDAQVVDGEKKLHHKINWREDRGPAYCYYASCRRKGRLDYEVMTKSEVDAIRKRSRAGSSGPWVTDYDEMAKKTVLRRMSKRWDISPELKEALDNDDDRFDNARDVTPRKKGQTEAPKFLPEPSDLAPEAQDSPRDDESSQESPETPPAAQESQEQPAQTSCLQDVKDAMESNGVRSNEVVAYLFAHKMAPSDKIPLKSVPEEGLVFALANWKDVVASTAGK